LDRHAVGLGVTAFVSVNIERHRDVEATRFREAVAAMPEVVSCYITSGEHDFLLQVEVADLDAYRDFTLRKLLRKPGVRSVNSSFVIDISKDFVALPLAPRGLRTMLPPVSQGVACGPSCSRRALPSPRRLAPGRWVTPLLPSG